MQDTILISRDDRRFTFWEWLGFLLPFTYIAMFCAIFFTGVMAAIWENILSGDYTGTDVFWAILWSTIAGPPLLFLYGSILWHMLDGPFGRKAVLLDTRDNQLLVKTRYITGRTYLRVVPLSDIRGVTVEWTNSEGGPGGPEARILTKGAPIALTPTNPADAANLHGFTSKVRDALIAAGWRDGH